MTTRFHVAFVALLGLLSAPLHAQCTSQPLATLAAALPDQEFGRTVVMQRDELFVGAANSPAGTLDFGRVVLFTRLTEAWAPIGELLPPDGPDGRGFGRALAVQGDRLVVGASSGSIGGVLQGAAYVFDRTGGTWTFTAKLGASDGKIFDFFGSSVALDGDVIVVGAEHASKGGVSGEGAAYVFELGPAGWVQTARLPETASQPSGNVGATCAVDGDTIVVGRKGGSSQSSSSGRVHVFVRALDGSWPESQILKGMDPMGDFFGYCLQLAGDTLLVGAVADDFAELPSLAGAVYDFERVNGSFVQVQRLVADDPADLETFGGSLALDGARLAVGSATPGSQSNLPGAVHVYARDGGPWLRVATIDPPPGLTGIAESFGGCVALAGGHLVASADQDDALGHDAGEAIAFELGELHVPYGEGLSGLGGYVPEVHGTTCTDDGHVTLLLELRLGLGGAPCALFAGAEPGALAFAGGVMQVSPPWRILPFVLGGPSGVAGVGQLSIAGELPSGATLPPVFVQLVVADPAATGGYSLSRGVAIPPAP